MALRIGAVASACNHPLMYIVLRVLHGFKQWSRNIKAYVTLLCFIGSIIIYVLISKYSMYTFVYEVNIKTPVRFYSVSSISLTINVYIFSPLGLGFGTCKNSELNENYE